MGPIDPGPIAQAVTEVEHFCHNAAMPWILYRYMLRDLVRTIGLTTAILVTVIAFGATIKPLANDSLLSATQTMKYLVLVMVPMMQFALPFSAGFAATLSLHRMTSENEVLAVAVSGVSYFKILLPVVALALVLSASMVLLTQWIIPKFWGIMEQTIARDVTTIFQNSLRRGEPFALGNLQIYADEIRVQPQPPDTGADTRLRLWGMAAAELDSDGSVTTDVTAEQAVIDIYRRIEGPILKMVLLNTVIYNTEEGSLLSFPRLEPNAIPIPRVFGDHTRNMTRGELLWYRANPEKYGKIIRAKQKLAAKLSDVELWHKLDAHIRGTGRMTFTEIGPENRNYILYADQIQKGRFRYSDGQRVRIEQFSGSTANWWAQADEIQIRRDHRSNLNDPAREGGFELLLAEYEIKDLQLGGPSNQREHLLLPAISLSGFSQDRLDQLSSEELLDRVENLPGSEGSLRKPVNELQSNFLSLENEVVSRIWKRYALSVTAFMLLMLGTIMAMALRDSLPLMIYLLSFTPAVLDLILISGGEQVMRDGHLVLGFIVMWSGNAIMAVLILGTYLRLMRH